MRKRSADLRKGWNPVKLSDEKLLLQSVLESTRRSELFLGQIASLLSNEDALVERRILEKTSQKEEIGELISEIRRSRKKQ